MMGTILSGAQQPQERTVPGRLEAEPTCERSPVTVGMGVPGVVL